MGTAKQLKEKLANRIGQSLTSTVIGVVILGIVGVAAANLMEMNRTADSALSASTDAAAILDSYANNIRSTTKYHEIEQKFGGGKTFLDGGYQIKTSVTKVCNTGAGNSNCDAMNVVVDVYDKASGKKVASQTIKRVYTHYAESKSFASAGSMVLPEDTIGFSYEAEGGKGNSGSGASSQANLLAVHTKACPVNYQPDAAGTTCLACTGPANWKQYWSGDCAVGTCPMGQQANAAKTGCENIVCTGHTKLVGDECQVCPLESDKQYYTAASGCSVGTCPTGQIANAAGNGCEAITCPSGQELQGDNCVDPITRDGLYCVKAPKGKTLSFHVTTNLGSKRDGSVTVGNGGRVCCSLPQCAQTQNYDICRVRLDGIDSEYGSWVIMSDNVTSGNYNVSSMIIGGISVSCKNEN